MAERRNRGGISRERMDKYTDTEPITVEYQGKKMTIAEVIELERQKKAKGSRNAANK